MTKDPNLMLARIRTGLLALGQAIQASGAAGTGGTAQTSSAAPARDAGTLIELITTLKELDRHLSAGGNPPSDWEVAFPARSQPGGGDRGADLFRSS